LQANGASPFHLLRVGDLDPPAAELEPVVHEAGSVIDSIAARISAP